MHNHQRLSIWHHSCDLALDVYRVTRQWPREDLYGLTSQVRRSSVSIAANIAEGSSAASRKGFVRYLRIALGSAFEVETLLRIAAGLGYIGGAELASLGDDVDRAKRMLINLIKSSQPWSEIGDRKSEIGRRSG